MSRCERAGRMQRKLRNELHMHAGPLEASASKKENKQHMKFHGGLTGRRKHKSGGRNCEICNQQLTVGQAPVKKSHAHCAVASPPRTHIYGIFLDGYIGGVAH